MASKVWQQHCDYPLHGKTITLSICNNTSLQKSVLEKPCNVWFFFALNNVRHFLGWSAVEVVHLKLIAVTEWSKNPKSNVPLNSKFTIKRLKSLATARLFSAVPTTLFKRKSKCCSKCRTSPAICNAPRFPLALYPYSSDWGSNTGPCL